jgi:hypothetical protein
MSVLCIVVLNLSVWALMAVIIWRPSKLSNSFALRSELECGQLNSPCNKSSEREDISSVDAKKRD